MQLNYAFQASHLRRFLPFPLQSHHLLQPEKSLHQLVLRVLGLDPERGQLLLDCGAIYKEAFLFGEGLQGGEVEQWHLELYEIERKLARLVEPVQCTVFVPQEFLVLRVERVIVEDVGTLPRGKDAIGGSAYP